MVVEVPRWSNAKMEINLKEKMNPIKQDYKKGKLRFVANCFPHKGYIWNYGALPQTWEDPEHIDASTKCKGDGDPIDVCEIGQKVHKRGDVVQVKVLGTVALIDDGETDWKLLAIDVTDPLADKLNDITDIEKHMPGFIAATVEWFKIYKMPDGRNIFIFCALIGAKLCTSRDYFVGKLTRGYLKQTPSSSGNPPNKFAFDGKAQNREFALKVVDETHVAWKELMARSADPEGLSRACTQVDATAAKISANEARNAVDAAAPRHEDARTDDAVDKWHYIKL
jgi:nucleosome-remodeling factor subunit